MNSLDIVMLICLVGVAAALAVTDVRVIKAWKNSAEKVTLPEIWDILSMILFASGVSCCYAVGHMSLSVYVLSLAVTLLFIPCAFTMVTPAGVIVPEIKKDCLRPAADYSYEYSRGRIVKDALDLYYKDEKSIRLYFGIKNTKLITMLNNNYEKHGYENPMLRGE